MAVKPEPYDEGDEVELDLVFTDAAGDPKDPTDVVLELACPDEQTLVFTFALGQIVRVSQGLFRLVYLIANGTGRYQAEGRGTGALPIVQRRTFQVREPA